ncbi:MAG TPA: transposase [Desulfobulbaceae bacterium]|nr:transposase [Desulfobulbaceae bacterium]
MLILHSLLSELKEEFAHSRKNAERGPWFIYTLVAIILPFTSSRTSNLLRALETLFGFSINKKKYYRFMASPKIPWDRLWIRLWKLIPEPETNGRLLVALDDFINPKTGKYIFGCANIFDHAAKQNQSKYPWAQNVVTIGLLKIIKGRWACLPLSFRYYHLKKEIEKNRPEYNGKKVEFQSKHDQAVAMLCDIAAEFSKSNILVVTDSWFGNNGLWKPLRKKLGKRAHMISRLRSNNNLFDEPLVPRERKRGRPRKYGNRLGTPSSLAGEYKEQAQEYTVNLYGKARTVRAYDRVVILKSLKRRVRVVWIFRNTQWVALFSTDLTLSVREIIEYYGARWKIEACFKELKRDIGSADTQTRNSVAVTNHLEFCMMATTLTWVYACRLEKTPRRRHAVKGRGHFAFSDVRGLVAKAAMDDNFVILCPVQRKSVINSLVTAFLRMAA